MTSCALKNPAFSISVTLPRRQREQLRCIDDVYPQVFDAILEHPVAKTQRFTEESLSQRFGASRSVIRQVLERLARQQVVILRPNHRPQVAAPDAEQTRQILHARRLAETTLTRLACQQPASRHLPQLRQWVERERQCLQQNQRAAAIRLSGEFHLQLAVVAGNAPLAQFLERLVPLTSLALAQGQAPILANGTWQAHQALVEAVERGDARMAETLINRHLDDLQGLLLNT
jgi:DNA-binding GntR family transcriptional regulator